MAFTTAGDSRPYPGPIVRMPGGQVVTRRELMVPLGQGECDWPTFLGLLYEIGYDYWINYEMCSPAREGGSEANLDRIASASLAYIRRAIDDAYGRG
jgi:sugar phosphate isomerase/epimerase